MSETGTVKIFTYRLNDVNTYSVRHGLIGLRDKNLEGNFR